MRRVRDFLFIAILVVICSGCSQSLSPESVAFLKNSSPDAQQRMITAIREALENKPDKLKAVRDSMRCDTQAPAGVKVENSKVAGQHIRFYFPQNKPTSSIVLYFHGGGFVLGSHTQSARFCGELAKRAQIDVATLDYRLAPEYKAPAALNDCLAAIRMLQERGYQKIYLAGDSAGGNLAAAAALRLRSEIAGIVLFYPAVLIYDDNSESVRKFGRGYGLDSALMAAFANAYANGDAALNPEVSPLLAKEFKNYPPTLIVAADYDVLFDQGKEFAALLKKNDIECEHVTIPGTLHAFMTYPDMDRAYENGMREILAFLRNT